MSKRGGWPRDWYFYVPGSSPLYRNLFDAVETASMIDPHDRRNFFHSSKELGTYYETRPRQRFILAELTPEEQEADLDFDLIPNKV